MKRETMTMTVSRRLAIAFAAVIAVFIERSMPLMKVTLAS